MLQRLVEAGADASQVEGPGRPYLEALWDHFVQDARRVQRFWDTLHLRVAGRFARPGAGHAAASHASRGEAAHHCPACLGRPLSPHALPCSEHIDAIREGCIYEEDEDADFEAAAARRLRAFAQKVALLRAAGAAPLGSGEAEAVEDAERRLRQRFFSRPDRHFPEKWEESGACKDLE